MQTVYKMRTRRFRDHTKPYSYVQRSQKARKHVSLRTCSVVINKAGYVILLNDVKDLSREVVRFFAEFILSEVERAPKKLPGFGNKFPKYRGPSFFTLPPLLSGKVLGMT